MDTLHRSCHCHGWGAESEVWVVSCIFWAPKKHGKINGGLLHITTSQQKKGLYNQITLLFVSHFSPLKRPVGFFGGSQSSQRCGRLRDALEDAAEGVSVAPGKPQRTAWGWFFLEGDDGKNLGTYGFLYGKVVQGLIHFKCFFWFCSINSRCLVPDIFHVHPETWGDKQFDGHIFQVG